MYARTTGTTKFEQLRGPNVQGETILEALGESNHTDVMHTKIYNLAEKIFI